MNQKGVHRTLALRLLLMTALVVPASALLSAAPASAAAKESCSLSNTTKVSPGLGSTPVAEKFNATVTLSGCTGAGGKTSGTAKATLHSKMPPTANCQSLFTTGNTAAGSATVTWNDGTKSKGGLTITVDRPTHGTLSGKITNKNISPPAFTGARFGGDSSFVPQNGSCVDANPVTQLAGSGTLTVT